MQLLRYFKYLHETKFTVLINRNKQIMTQLIYPHSPLETVTLHPTFHYISTCTQAKYTSLCPISGTVI